MPLPSHFNFTHNQRPHNQVVKVGQFTSNSITLNVGAPQGCVLSPLLYSLYTHDCVSSHSSTSTVKFADDTVVLGLVSNNDEAAYLDEVERLTSWCQDNCLSEREQNQRADCRLQEETAAALHSSYDQRDPCGEGEQLQVPRCKHLRGPDMDCTHPNTDQESQAKTVPSATAEEIQGLTSYPETFYSGTIESVLTQCISVWYNNATNQDCKALQRVVRLAERISGSTLPSLQGIYLKRCRSRAAKIIKDSNHPGNHLFILLPSGRRYRSMLAKTERLRRSFFPQAIRLLNSVS